MSRRSVMVASAPDRTFSPVQDDGLNIAASALVTRRHNLITWDMQGHAKRKVFSIVLHVYGFVRPSQGEAVWFLADAVNTAMFTAILAVFAREVGAGPDKRVVLVLDGAGWHVAADLVIPEGIELLILPPYSPELQPAECLWPLLREAVANDHIDDLASLDHVLGDRCNALTDDPDTIRGRTLFHWWPALA